jgi:hypothetical protein
MGTVLRLRPGTCPRAMPLARAISRVQLAICWKPRESGATAKILDAVTKRPVRTISRKGLETGKPPPGILRGQTPATSRERGEVMVRAAWRHAGNSTPGDVPPGHAPRESDLASAAGHMLETP